jgi:hypothetical protein
MDMLEVVVWNEVYLRSRIFSCPGALLNWKQHWTDATKCFALRLWKLSRWQRQDPMARPKDRKIHHRIRDSSAIFLGDDGGWVAPGPQNPRQLPRTSSGPTCLIEVTAIRCGSMRALSLEWSYPGFGGEAFPLACDGQPSSWAIAASQVLLDVLGA